MKKTKKSDAELTPLNEDTPPDAHTNTKVDEYSVDPTKVAELLHAKYAQPGNGENAPGVAYGHREPGDDSLTPCPVCGTIASRGSVCIVDGWRIP